MLILTDHTRGHTVRSHDAVLIGHLHLLWLIWGHVVTLTRLDEPIPSTHAAAGPVAPPTQLVG